AAKAAAGASRVWIASWSDPGSEKRTTSTEWCASAALSGGAWCSGCVGVGAGAGVGFVVGCGVGWVCGFAAMRAATASASEPPGLLRLMMNALTARPRIAMTAIGARTCKRSWDAMRFLSALRPYGLKEAAPLAQGEGG